MARALHSKDFMNKNQLISAKILALVALGMPVKIAIDSVLGEGVSAKVIGEAYDALKARAAR